MCGKVKKWEEAIDAVVTDVEDSFFCRDHYVGGGAGALGACGLGAGGWLVDGARCGLGQCCWLLAGGAAGGLLGLGRPLGAAGCGGCRGACWGCWLLYPRARPFGGAPDAAGVGCCWVHQPPASAIAYSCRRCLLQDGCAGWAMEGECSEPPSARPAPAQRPFAAPLDAPPCTLAAPPARPPHPPHPPPSSHPPPCRQEPHLHARALQGVLQAVHPPLQAQGGRRGGGAGHQQGRDTRPEPHSNRQGRPPAGVAARRRRGARAARRAGRTLRSAARPAGALPPAGAPGWPWGPPPRPRAPARRRRARRIRRRRSARRRRPPRRPPRRRRTPWPARRHSCRRRPMPRPRRTPR